mmetsp:Transcript_18747/g.51508  ORF Transcript_18747/g.51508 Transcript_18747/m.51508 type:complete len:425 (-) Transcript_18747:112-1386(-)
MNGASVVAGAKAAAASVDVSRRKRDELLARRAELRSELEGIEIWLKKQTVEVGRLPEHLKFWQAKAGARMLTRGNVSAKLSKRLQNGSVLPPPSTHSAATAISGPDVAAEGRGSSGASQAQTSPTQMILLSRAAVWFPGLAPDFVAGSSRVSIATVLLGLILVLSLVVLSICFDVRAVCMQSPQTTAKALAQSVRCKLQVAGDDLDAEAMIPLDAQIPRVCPDYVTITSQTVLSLSMAPFNSIIWTVDIAGIDCSSSTAPRLQANLRWTKREGLVARVLEVSALGPDGPGVIMSCGSNLQVQFANHVPFGCLRLVSAGRYALRSVDGSAVMALSCDHNSRRVEMATLPEGRLVATATRVGGSDDALGSEDERLEVSTRRGADPIFALGCALAVLVFAPPRKNAAVLGQTAGQCQSLLQRSAHGV